MKSEMGSGPLITQRGQTNRQTDEHTYKQTDKQTDRHTDIQTYRQ